MVGGVRPTPLELRGVRVAERREPTPATGEAALGDQIQGLRSRLHEAAECVAALLVALYLAHLLNALLGHRLIGLGVRPRTVLGLLGILLHPFIHASFAHLLVNTVPLAVLGGLVALRGTDEFVELGLFVVLAEGAALWLLGRTGAAYVGASGVVFGFLGYLLARGWYERTPVSVAIAVGVGLLYGAMLLALLPWGGGSSWQVHLPGFAAGFIAARVQFHRPAGVGPDAPPRARAA
jgi:membrane associated rhomboid family serine protease